jgi:hypothetical protein
VSLLSQIEAAAGRPLEIHYAEEFRKQFGLSRKEFIERTERIGRAVDMRAFVAGNEKTSGPLLVLVSDYRGGLLIQLWELRDT